MRYPIKKPAPIFFTKEGLTKIALEKEELTERRIDAVMHLKKARDMGDLKENGYYKASRQKLNQIDGRIRRVNHLLRYGVVVKPKDAEVVQVGIHVVLVDGKKEFAYQIVGGEEANPSEGRLSYLSPLGRALMGKNINDTVSVETPSGKTTYTILALTTS